MAILRTALRSSSLKFSPRAAVAAIPATQSSSGTGKQCMGVLRFGGMSLAYAIATARANPLTFAIAPPYLEDRAHHHR